MSLSSEVRPHVFSQIVWPLPAEASDLSEDTRAEPEPLDLEAIKAEAWDEGFQRGYEEGLRIAAEQQQTKVEALARLAERARADASALVRALEEQAVELSLAVAEKVVEREARADREVVLRVIRRALEEIEDATVVLVRVNPDDYDLVRRHWDEATARGLGSIASPARQPAELLADEMVEAGGCVIETRVGRVDAQLSTKLAQIATTFHALLDGEPL